MPATTPPSPPGSNTHAAPGLGPAPTLGTPSAASRRATPRLLLLFILPLVFVAASQAWAYLNIEARDFKPDFRDFWLAARAVIDGISPYDVGRRWYVYPPLLAILLTPLATLPLPIAGAIFAFINTTLIGTTAWLAAREFARRLAANIWSDTGRAALIAVVAAAVLLSLDKSLAIVRLGQTDAFIALCIVIALACLGRRPRTAGLALALAANIKYQSLIFLPYLLLRRRFAEAGSLLLASVAIALASSLVFGWSTNLDYLTRALGSLARLSGLPNPDPALQPIHPLTWERSVSIPSALARFLERESLAPSWAFPLTLAIAALTFLLSWLLYRLHRQPLFLGRSGRQSDRSARCRLLTAVEWVGLIIALLAFSPQSSARHYFLVLIPFAFAGMLTVVAWNRRRSAALFASGAAIAIALGLILPPGSDTFAAALAWWRSVGGATWVTLLAWLALLHATLTLAPTFTHQPPATPPSSTPAPPT